MNLKCALYAFIFLALFLFEENKVDAESQPFDPFMVCEKEATSCYDIKRKTGRHHKCMLSYKNKASMPCQLAIRNHELCIAVAAKILAKNACKRTKRGRAKCLLDNRDDMSMGCQYMADQAADDFYSTDESNRMNTYFEQGNPHALMRYTPKLYTMCSQCLWNTLETTIRWDSPDKKRAFVITGDIADMWTRDSAAQVHPYVFLAKTNETLLKVVVGAVVRNAFNIIQDPYANSYSQHYRDPAKLSKSDRSLNRGNYTTTYNYELDSGCYFFRLMYETWKIAGNREGLVENQEILQKASHAMVDVWIVEQNHEKDSPYRYKELKRNGLGGKTKYTGLTWTGFRPSDDKCTYHYLIPANIFAIKVLGELQEIASEIWSDSGLAQKAHKLELEIRKGLKEHAIHRHETYGDVYCYEVDGFGGCELMDDANVPSLLALPYLDKTQTAFDPEIYQNTRRMILSKSNRFYYKGKFAQGIGSPHVGLGSPRPPHNWIWPMSLIIQAMTATSAIEKLELTEMVIDTTGGTNFMHESFSVNNPSRFTRSWFAWVNALFAELMFHMTGEWCDKPDPNANPTNGGRWTPKGV